jgi:hypothetical protein
MTTAPELRRTRFSLYYLVGYLVPCSDDPPWLVLTAVVGFGLVLTTANYALDGCAHNG